MMKTDRDKFLTPEECLKLIQTVKSEGEPRDYMLFLLGMNLGLRVSELVRLRVEHFAFDENAVRVPTLKRLHHTDKALKRKIRLEGGRWKKPKLARGEMPKLFMEVPIVDEVIREVRRYLKRRSGWLFPGRNDLHLSSRHAERIFKAWIARLGFSPLASIHALRHARGVDLQEKGFTTTEIKEVLRHESESSTMVYKHLTPSRRQEILGKIGALGMVRRPLVTQGRKMVSWKSSP